MNILSIAILFLEVVVLVGFAALCSGLNIALMALDLADLKRRANTGNRDAKRMLPLRKNSHLSLAAILFTNVGAVSATSLVLSKHINGLLAGIISTLLIVVFGEVLPQAFFSRRALAISSRFKIVLQAMILVTYPVSKPLQLLLDRLFGEQEKARLQSRDELGLLIAEHLERPESELDDDEIEIIRGALQLSEKHTRDITTPMRNVYWVTPTTLIDAAKIDEIKARGWSRIPVFNQQLTTCYGLVLMKDLVDIDFDNEPVAVVGDAVVSDPGGR